MRLWRARVRSPERERAPAPVAPVYGLATPRPRSRGRGTLSARLIHQARTELLGERPSGALGKKVSLRFSAEMSSFMAWLARLKAAIQEGRIDDALFMISELEKTKRIADVLEKERKRRRSKRYPDVEMVGDSQLLTDADGKEGRAFCKLRLDKNLEDLPELQKWASNRGFTVSVDKKRQQHWIVRGPNFTAEWWPSTAKLVLHQKYTKGIETHDWLQLCVVLDEVQRTGKWKSLSFGKDP